MLALLVLADALVWSLSHNDRLKFDVAREGMNLSDCPMSLRKRVVYLRVVPTDGQLEALDITPTELVGDTVE